MTGFERKIEEGTKSKVVLEGTSYFFGKVYFILLDNYNKRMQELRKVESIYEFYQKEFADKTFSDDWWIRTAMKEAREKAEISKYAFEAYKKQVYGDGECPTYFYGREVIPS